MRPDFKKLLCERPRTLSHNSSEVFNETKFSGKEKHLDYDEYEPGRKIGIKKTFYGTYVAYKGLNEYLQPLMKFLKTKVGKDWNSVRSEISKVCPKDSAVNAHIWEHLKHSVVESPLYLDGVVYGNSFNRNPLTSTEKHPVFYVNDKGLMVEAPRRIKQKVIDANEKQRRSAIEKDLGWSEQKKSHIWAVKINGKWHEAKFKAFKYGNNKVFAGLEQKIPAGAKPEIDVYILTLPPEHRPSYYKKMRHVNEQNKVLSIEEQLERNNSHLKYYGKEYEYIHELRLFTISERKKHNLRNKE